MGIAVCDACKGAVTGEGGCNGERRCGEGCGDV